jgi:NifU-like protein involved in Fe-S cluster formation
MTDIPAKRQTTEISDNTCPVAFNALGCASIIASASARTAASVASS